MINAAVFWEWHLDFFIFRCKSNTIMPHVRAITRRKVGIVFLKTIVRIIRYYVGNTWNVVFSTVPL